jgi:hypothetical protein
MNWIGKKLRIGFWKRRVRAFNEMKAKPIKDLTQEDLKYMREFYDETIRQNARYIMEFDEVDMNSKLRIKNSRMYAEFMITKLK